MKTFSLKACMILSCVIITLSATAQSRISSVYGVNLGDTESTVSSKLTGTWKTYEAGRYYSVNSPTLGDCTFEEASFMFKGGRLSSVCFSSYDGGAMDPNFRNAYGGANGYEMFLANGRKFERMFRTMRSDLTSKYGSPIVDDENRCIWRSNGNEIKLEYSFEDETNPYGWHQGVTQVSVIYKTVGASSSNF